jgi:hypothetical protein
MKKTIFLLLTLVVQFVSAQNETELQIQKFPVPVFTNSNLSLVILGSAWYNSPLLGDEIAVIDSNDEIVGNSVVLQGHNGLAIWGDNPLTKVKDGLFVGEQFRIVHWSKNTDTYTVYSNFSTQTGTNSYLKDGFTIVNSVGNAESYTRETAVYVHIKSVLSERSKYSFYVQEKGVYSLEVRSSKAVVFELKEVFFEKGYHTFNAPSLIPKGTYFINLSSDNKVLASKNFIVD